jgi:hypothetical protein
MLTKADVVMSYHVHIHVDSGALGNDGICSQLTDVDCSGKGNCIVQRGASRAGHASQLLDEIAGADFLQGTERVQLVVEYDASDRVVWVKHLQDFLHAIHHLSPRTPRHRATETHAPRQAYEYSKADKELSALQLSRVPFVEHQGHSNAAASNTNRNASLDSRHSLWLGRRPLARLRRSNNDRVRSGIVVECAVRARELVPRIRLHFLRLCYFEAAVAAPRAAATGQNHDDRDDPASQRHSVFVVLLAKEDVFWGSKSPKWG